jgi:hypothetical protein
MSGDRLFLYSSYYQSALYIVIEGWRDLGLNDPVIDGLLVSEYVDLLRRFRHGTFHFQPEYLDARILNLAKSDGVAEWIRNVRDAFSAWFDQFFKDAEARHPKEHTP